MTLGMETFFIELPIILYSASIILLLWLNTFSVLTNLFLIKKLSLFHQD